MTQKGFRILINDVENSKSSSILHRLAFCVLNTSNEDFYQLIFQLLKLLITPPLYSAKSNICAKNLFNICVRCFLNYYITYLKFSGDGQQLDSRAVKMIHYITDLTAHFLKHMNCEPLRDCLIQDDLLKKIFENFDSSPLWVKNTMVQVIKYGVQCGAENFDDYLISTGVFEHLISVVSASNGKKNMLVCTIWSVFRDISKRENPSLAIKICENYHGMVNTIVLCDIMCPLMQIASKCTAAGTSVPHICTESSEDFQDPPESEREDSLNFEDESIMTCERRNASKRKRINSYSKGQREKKESFERNRKRFKSMAFEEENLLPKEKKKAKSFKLGLTKCDKKNQNAHREEEKDFKMRSNETPNSSNSDSLQLDAKMEEKETSS
ncbi:unnamed protein product [Moneuplotes crassus]|uniref:Serine/threonine-protein phosphatase 4 regulatory subunit 3-like central domain-containing protein n=1 Tax=Euplotes crassus TaxID=5936 RepID=A0AAD2D6X7_EUPCR|nr:unnamed protein product [Moneuplotes crassus]